MIGEYEMSKSQNREVYVQRAIKFYEKPIVSRKVSRKVS